MNRKLVAGSAALLAFGLVTTAPASAQFRQEIGNDLSQCSSDAGPSMLVTVDGISVSSGQIRVQSYRATSSEWLQKGRWINRIETRARAGTMTFCLPLPAAGSYGIAVRHDANGNGKTDLSSDGGGMSNNPSINIFNLGKPGHRSVAVPVGENVRSIRIQMKYM